MPSSPRCLRFAATDPAARSSRSGRHVPGITPPSPHPSPHACHIPGDPWPMVCWSTCAYVRCLRPWPDASSAGLLCCAPSERMSRPP